MRMKPEARKSGILTAALPLAVRCGYATLTREQITTAAGVTGPVLNYYFGTMRQFRQALLHYAIERKAWAVVAQAIVAGDPEVRDIPDAMRRRALQEFSHK